MKLPQIIATIALLCVVHFAQSQEWRLYTASDAVNTFELYQNDIWTISGSGLSKIEILSGEVTTWNTLNSNLPDYAYDVMSIDSNGTIWLGNSEIESTIGLVSTKLIKFNGTYFETIGDINGNIIRSVSSIETTPDGKVWVQASANGNHIFFFENNQFIAIPPPPNSAKLNIPRFDIGIDDQSNIWIVFIDTLSNQNLIGQFDGSNWTIHDVTSFGQEPTTLDYWANDHAGNVFLLMRGHVSPTQIVRFDGQQWNEITPPNGADTAQYVDHPLYADNQNQLWLSLADNTLMRYDGSNWTTTDLNSLGFTNGYPDQLIIDQHDNWWLNYNHFDSFGYDLSYLYHYENTVAHQIDLSNSTIPSNDISDIVVDELNTKWLSAKNNLVKFDGQQWTSITAPHGIYPWPIGSNTNGGVWLFPYEFSVAQFDGVAFSQTPVSTPEGIPIDYFSGYTVDQKGQFITGSFNPNIIVLDHGNTIYLDSLRYEFAPGQWTDDNATAVAVDSSEQIYAVGRGLYRMASDSSWIFTSLWDDLAYGYKLDIAPDGKVWVLDPSFGYKLWIHDGTNWTQFDSPMELQSVPKWDHNGNPWFITQQGLCKYSNGSWQCYNRSNSPLIPERLSDFAIDRFNNLWIIQQNGGMLIFNEDYIHSIGGQDQPLISGVVYRDLNQNGINDATDTPLAYQHELLLPDSTIVFSNYNGTYHLSATAGDHEVKYLPRPNWHIDNSPASYNVTIDSASVTGLDFNLVPDHEMVDLNLFLNEGFPRCARVSSYWLSFNNLGTRTESVEVVFIKDPKTDLVNASPTPDVVSGDTIKWNFSGLIPFGTDFIRIDLRIPGPPDTSIFFSCFLNLLGNDGYQPVDSVNLTQEIRCSFDPNDKIARTVRSAGEGKSYLDDPLMYTIRFQNTGNDTAFTIIVRDTLDADLDLNTLEIIGASHPYEAFLKQDRTLEFRFSNILLPDSTANEMASHGFVSYSIKAKADLPSPAIIENTAHIYFDFNQAVQTNTAVNELIEFGTGIYNEAKLITFVKAYPNPTSDEIIIEALKNEYGLIKFSLVSMQGQILQTGVLNPQETKRISLTSLPSGVYMLKATSGLTYQTLLLVKD